MRILIVNFFYAPCSNAHSFRWTQLAEYWARQGKTVEVITGRYEDEPAYEFINKVSVTRIGWPKSFSYESDYIANYPSNKIFRFLRFIYTKIRWPDSLWYWTPFVFFAISKKFKNNYDLVISYYPIYSANLAVFFMKLFCHNNKFKWILDYGDPFSTSELIQPNNFFLYKKMNIFLERYFAKKGQLVFYNNELVNEYIEKLSLKQKEFPIKVDSLIDLDKLYSSNNLKNLEPPQKIILNYIGKFYASFREPYILFDLIEKLNNISNFIIELNIYGPNGGFALDKINSNFIKYKGFVNRQNAIVIMRESQFLVNIENTNCLQSPSKTAEIIATGKPIINISNPYNPDNLLQKYSEVGGCISIFRDKINRSTLSLLMDFILNKYYFSYISKKDIESVLKDNLIQNVSKKYLSFVN